MKTTRAAEYFKTAREKKKVSQKLMSERLGASHQYVSAIENGRSAISLNFINRTSRLLRLSRADRAAFLEAWLEDHRESSLKRLGLE